MIEAALCPLAYASLEQTPYLYAFPCILFYVLWIVYCQYCGSLLEDFSVSLPDTGQAKWTGESMPLEVFSGHKWIDS